MSTILEKFIDEIDKFCAERGLSASEYGEMAMNDRSFVHDLRAGRRAPRLSTISRNEAFIAEARRKGVNPAA